MKSLLLANTLFFPSLGIAGYVLQDSYDASNWLSKFTAFTGTDPTAGFVDYVDFGTAQSKGLLTTTGGSVKMGADSTNVTPGGRPSIRIQSVDTYSSGLIIADIAHMPGSICGAWPAFWTVGPDWPNNGEIDIIEGVNSATVNSMTLHTGPGCSINDADFTGLIKTSNCYVDATGQGNNVGCGISASGSATYGDPFNSAGGGVYATEWTSQSISIYFFSRSSIPADITSGSPNPAGWGQPMAQFQGSCNIPDSFRNHSIVFDTTFCGQWAGQSSVWSSDPVCGKKAATCNDYVQNNPSDFADAYWDVNSVKVYQQSGGYIGSTPSASPSAASAAGSASSVPSGYPSGVPAIPKPSTLATVPVPFSAAPAAASAAIQVAEPAASSTLAQDSVPAASSVVAVPAPAPAATGAAPPTGSSGIPIPFPQSGKSHHHHPKESAAAAEMRVAAISRLEQRGNDGHLQSRHFRHVMAHRRGLFAAH